MSKLIIEGKHKLSGAMNIHGAKNSALPVLAATILANGISEIHNCPQLSDVAASVRILRHLGCNVSRSENCVTVDSLGLCRSDIPDTLMREMRSSIVFLGAIAARTGEAHLTFPGGCELGTRPIDLHVSALRQLGMEILEDGGRLECSVKARMKGATIALAFPSVGATENIILASVTAEGTTSILNAAREPEIVDLCNYLNKCGARITGAGESAITIEGWIHFTGALTALFPTVLKRLHICCRGHYGKHPDIKIGQPAACRDGAAGVQEAGCAAFPQRGGKNQRARQVEPGAFGADNALSGVPDRRAGAGDGDGNRRRRYQRFIENIFESRYKHAGN